MNKPYVTAAVLAAGLGSRLSLEQTKQKIDLLGKSIVRRAVEIFDKSLLVDDIIVVVRQEEEDFIKNDLSGIRKPHKLVIGGDFRAQSAKNAFLALNPEAEFIAIHDAARCITDLSDIENVIKDAFLYGAASASREVIDTAKEIRQYDNNVKIIFLTSSAEFAVQSYTVGAFFYQMKPIWEERFYRLMDSVLSECKKVQECSLILRCKTGIARIELDKLEYCEVIGRTLFFYLEGGKVLESVGRLDDLHNQLEL